MAVFRISTSLHAYRGDCRKGVSSAGDCWIVEFYDATERVVAGARVFALPQSMQFAKCELKCDSQKGEACLKVLLSET